MSLNVPYRIQVSVEFGWWKNVKTPIPLIDPQDEDLYHTVRANGNGGHAIIFNSGQNYEWNFHKK